MRRVKEVKERNPSSVSGRSGSDSKLDVDTVKDTELRTQFEHSQVTSEGLEQTWMLETPTQIHKRQFASIGQNRGGAGAPVG